jgi:hypothetical protein
VPAPTKTKTGAVYIFFSSIGDALTISSIASPQRYVRAT